MTLSSYTCLLFVTYCLGYTEGYFVFRVLQQTDLSSQLTQIIVPRCDCERQWKNPKRVDVWQVVKYFFFHSKIWMQNAKGCTKILAETWFFSVQSAVLHNTNYFLNELLHGGKKIKVALKYNKFRTHILKLNSAGRRIPHRFHSTLLGLAGVKLLSGKALDLFHGGHWTLSTL